MSDDSNWTPTDATNVNEPKGQFDTRIGVDDVLVAPAVITGYDPGGHTPDKGPSFKAVPDKPEEVQ